MRFSIFHLLILLLFSLPAGAQLDSLGFFTGKGINNASFVAEDFFLARGTTGHRVEGNPYLDASWKEAQVLGLQDEVINIKARYRVYDDEMQVRHDGQVLALYPEKIKAIAIGQQVFVPLAFRNPDSGQEFGFFQILVNGETRLFLRRSMELVKSDYNPALNVGDPNDRLELKEHYYYKKREGPLRLLRQNRNSVLKALSRRKKAISEFAKANQLSPRKQEDLIAIFAFYNRQ